MITQELDRAAPKPTTLTSSTMQHEAPPRTSGHMPISNGNIPGSFCSLERLMARYPRYSIIMEIVFLKLPGSYTWENKELCANTAQVKTRITFTVLPKCSSFRTTKVIKNTTSSKIKRGSAYRSEGSGIFFLHNLTSF
jgi:hypothetical protein